MHTHPEYQYLELLKEILKNGDRKVDRGDWRRFLQYLW